MSEHQHQIPQVDFTCKQLLFLKYLNAECANGILYDFAIIWTIRQNWFKVRVGNILKKKNKFTNLFTQILYVCKLYKIQGTYF